MHKSTFFTDYFETEAGREQLELLVGHSIVTQLTTVELARILRNLDYSTLEPQQQELFHQLESTSKAYAVDLMVDQFAANGNESTAGVEAPSVLQIIRNPDRVDSKLAQLRQLKKFLKVTSKSLPDNDPLKQTKLTLIHLHQRRLNELLADTLRDQFLLTNEAVDTTQKVNRFHRNLARLDMFIEGAGDMRHPDDSRNFTSLVVTVVQKARDLVNDPTEASAASDSIFDEKQQATLREKSMNAEEIRDWLRLVLDDDGLLAEDQTYDPNRIGLVNDDPAKHWQVVVDPTKNTSLGLKQEHRAIRISPTLKRKLAKTNPKGAALTCAHERTHVFQTINGQYLGLGLAERVGTSQRRRLIGEGGSDLYTNQTASQLYGISVEEKPYLVISALALLNGKGFAGAVLENFQARQKVGSSTKDRTTMKNAIKATLRLLSNGSDLQANQGYLDNSYPLIYLEQTLVTNQLIQAGLGDLLWIGGLDLHAAEKLHQIGLLHVDQIEIKKPRRTIAEILTPLISQKLESKDKSN